MTGADCIRFFEMLKGNRQPIEPTWRDCYRYTFPIRGLGFTNNAYTKNLEAAAPEAKSEQAEIFDSTAPDSCELLASAIVTNMTPANAQWVGIETDDDKEANDWLAEAGKKVHRNIHASNFDAPAFEKALDLAVAGMGCMYIEEGTDAPYHFELWPLYDCYFATSKRGGLIDIVYHPFTLTAQQAVNEYGEGKRNDKLRKKALKTPFDPVQFIHAIFPKPKPQPGQRLKKKDAILPFASLHVEVETKQTVKEGGYAEFPCVVPRYIKLPNSVYATGPMLTALPDTKTLNEVERLTLAHGDMAIAGMWGAVDDGVLNPKTVRIGARRIIMMQAKDNFFPLSPGGSFDVSAILTDTKRKSIRHTLKADMLEPLGDGPAKTATEWHYRINIIRQLLGPMFGRFQTEDLQPLVFRCFSISLRKGELGNPPPALQGKRLRLRYFSPLARAQQLEEVASMDRFETDLINTAAAGKTDVLDVYDWDGAKRKKAELLGVDTVLIVKPEDVTKIREDRVAAAQKQQAQMQQMEMMKKQGGQQGAGMGMM